MAHVGSNDTQTIWSSEYFVMLYSILHLMHGRNQTQHCTCPIINHELVKLW